MTLSNRQYTPTIGKSVKLKEWSDYTARGIGVWSWMRVKAINSDGAVLQVLNGTEPTDHVLHVPYSAIAPPIGWKSRYTIHAKPEQVDTVLSWFARGIVVRQSHDMSGSMPTAFQPMDNAGQPHWQFVEVTDAIPAEDCARLFRVVKVERQDVYDVYLVPDPTCNHCNGTGRRNISTLVAARQSTFNKVHEEIVSGLIHVEDYDQVAGDFTCHCIRGGFRKLGRSKRAKLIKEWAVDGWVTEYRNLGEHSYWERTRETVIHDWTD